MSIRELFNRKPTAAESATSASLSVESYDYTVVKNNKNHEFVPRSDQRRNITKQL
mgnify:CR=1 FL=1